MWACLTVSKLDSHRLLGVAYGVYALPGLANTRIDPKCVPASKYDAVYGWAGTPVRGQQYNLYILMDKRITRRRPDVIIPVSTKFWISWYSGVDMLSPRSMYSYLYPYVHIHPTLRIYICHLIIQRG